MFYGIIGFLITKQTEVWRSFFGVYCVIFSPGTLPRLHSVLSPFWILIRPCWPYGRTRYNGHEFDSEMYTFLLSAASTKLFEVTTHRPPPPPPRPPPATPRRAGGGAGGGGTPSSSSPLLRPPLQKSPWIGGANCRLRETNCGNDMRENGPRKITVFRRPLMVTLAKIAASRTFANLQFLPFSKTNMEHQIGFSFPNNTTVPVRWCGGKLKRGGGFPKKLQKRRPSLFPIRQKWDMLAVLSWTVPRSASRGGRFIPTATVCVVSIRYGFHRCIILGFFFPGKLSDRTIPVK